MKSLEEWNAMGSDCLPGYLGIQITSVSKNEVFAVMTITPKHMAPNGFLHAGSIISLADTSAGYLKFSLQVQHSAQRVSAWNLIPILAVKSAR